MQRVAVFVLLILASFTQALAESTIDDAYAKNILLSDIHVQLASPSRSRELFVTGRVTNNGEKDVTGLKVSLVVGRRGMKVSRDFFIVQNGSTAVPLDARRPLKAHDSRSFSATLAGFSRSEGARVEIESLFTDEVQSHDPQRGDSGSAAWLLLGFVIAVGAALIIFYNLPSQRQARLQRAEEDAAQAQQAAEREKRLEEGAQKLVDIYTSASQQELPILNDQVSGVILQRGEACYLCEQSVGHVVLRGCL